MTVKKLATIGNSFGVIIDRPMLKQAGIQPGAHVAICVEEGAVVIRVAPTGAVRTRRGERRDDGAARLDQALQT